MKQEYNFRADSGSLKFVISEVKRMHEEKTLTIKNLVNGLTEISSVIEAKLKSAEKKLQQLLEKDEEQSIN